MFKVLTTTSTCAWSRTVITRVSRSVNNNMFKVIPSLLQAFSRSSIFLFVHALLHNIPSFVSCWVHAGLYGGQCSFHQILLESHGFCLWSREMQRTVLLERECITWQLIRWMARHYRALLTLQRTIHPTCLNGCRQMLFQQNTSR